MLRHPLHIAIQQQKEPRLRSGFGEQSQMDQVAMVITQSLHGHPQHHQLADHPLLMFDHQSAALLAHVHSSAAYRWCPRSFFSAAYHSA